MTDKRTTRLLLITVCLACAFRGAVLAEERDLPYRIDPLKQPVPDGATLLLWRFEDEKGTDSSIGGNHGKLVGQATGATQGRFGRGLHLHGGSALLSEKVSAQHLASLSDEAPWVVDFWCKPGSYSSQQPACLLDMPGALGVRLELTPKGHLRVSGPEIAPTTSAKSIPLGEWTHVAIRTMAFIQPNRIYLDKVCMEVLVNGGSAILAKMPRYRGLPAELHPASVGNSLRRDAGFAGWVDEFRISRGAAGFYQLVRQDFLKPEEAEPPVRSREHFRDPSAKAYVETFDEHDALQRVTPPPKPRLIRTAPPVVRVASTDTPGGAQGDAEDEDEPDLMEEMIEEDEQRETAPPVELAPGVRGKALVVRGGLARIGLPRLPDLPDGTLEFWFKPGNWDNLATPPGKLSGWSYRSRYAHLLTLWGLPRKGDGEAAELITLSIRRDRGQPLVAPEFQKYFAKPELPIVPHKWVHVLVTWSRRFPYLFSCEFDGKRLDRAKLAPAETWQTRPPAYVTLGNGYETAYDELRLHTYAFAGVEHFNARAAFTGETKRSLAEDDVGTPLSSLGDLKVAAPGSPLFYRLSGGWTKGWVTGIVTEGPVQVFFGYRLDMGKMIVAVALREPGSAARAEVAFHLPQGRTIKGTIPEFHDGKGAVLLDDVGLLPEGSFRLTGALLDAQGKNVSAFSSAFRRVPIPWLNNKLGLLETPPPTFEPVTVEGQAVTAVGREHTIGSDGNFRSLVINGEEILASSIRFEAQVGGRAVTLAGAGTEFGKRSPVEARWQSSAVGAGLEIRASVQFEYDGMARHDIDLRRTGGPVSVERLSLQIPLKDRYSQLVHVLPYGGSFRGYVTAGFLPPGEGPLWDSRTWSNRMPAAKRAIGNFVSMIWLGGMTRGLVWFADNDRGWVPNNERPAATITRQGGVVTLGLHFISKRFVLDHSRRITYGLLATPPKPLPADHRLWNRGNPGKVGTIAWRLTSCDAFAPWKVPPVEKAFDYWPRNDDWEFAKLACDVQRNLWRSDTPHGKYPKGIGLTLYHDADHCPVHPDARPYFGWIWRCRSFPQTRVDHLVWYLDKWIRYGIDGLYIDDTYPNGDCNEEPIGAAYFTTPDGTDYVTYDDRDRDRMDRLSHFGQKLPALWGMDHFRHRQYLKRVYAAFHTHGKRPIITTHMTDTLVWPFHSFVTAIYDGEHGARGHGSNKTYIDAWPLDYLMTIRNAERTGLITVNFGLQVPDDWEKTAPAIWQYVARRSWKAVALLFDSSHSPSKFEQPYYGTETEVYPFWRNSHLVRAAPALNGPVTDRDLPVPKWWTRISDHFYRSLAKQPLRVTLFKKENRCMVVVVNFLRRSVGAKITLDLEELGVPPEHRAGLTAADIDDWLPPPGTDLAKLHVADVPRTRKAALLSEIKEGGGFPDVPPDAGALEEDGPDEVETALTQPEGQPAPADPAQFFTVVLKGNVLRLNVAAHNFRAIEVSWGAE